jgi:hypothetical protein
MPALVKANSTLLQFTPSTVDALANILVVAMTADGNFTYMGEQHQCDTVF